MIGPDGIGKSSLLSIIAGARHIQTARSWCSTATCPMPGIAPPFVRVSPSCPKALGKNLYPDLSVRENIEFFGRLFGQPRAERDRRIAELL